MSCGKMYYVDLAIDALKFSFKNRPFMFKGKPYISYSLSIIVQYPNQHLNLLHKITLQIQLWSLFNNLEMKGP
jgi:hypothetical protein